MTNKKIPIFNLDEEEKVLSDSFDRDEWKTVASLDKEKKIAKAAASNYFKKAARINIRLSNNDLSRIKQIAAHEGLPYQTLISSLLHKYAAGRLSV